MSFVYYIVGVILYRCLNTKSLRKNSQFGKRERKKKNENKMKMALMICVNEQL